MKKKNIALALLAGEGVAGLVYGFIQSSQVESFLGIKSSILIWSAAILLPLISLLGLYICYLIGKRFIVVFQAGKFFLIGVLTTLFDLGIMNVLIWIFGQASGWTYNTMKGISFLLATAAKYWGNKFLAFEKNEKERIKTEFAQFLAVTSISLLVNVGVASFIVNTVGPQFGLNQTIWANIGAIVASALGSIFNFIGYKFIVFKK
jgi:putative flippase GtrA